jgi:outer membrane receptor protein involved in Fe transport
MLMASAAALVMEAPAAAAELHNFDVPAGPAARTIPTFAKQVGIQILASATVLREKRTNAVHGTYSIEQGLTRLLDGTGLAASSAGETGIITVSVASLPKGESEAGGAPANDESAEVLVTGTRIRGAQVASPVTTITADAIRKSGRTTIGEAVRDLPQNFGGGQNPGVAGLGSQGGQNVNSSSTINLRGLGADATLTLFNGHRVAYDSLHQGIDVDQIPLAALDRIEIVPDGASALYGSDAVAGVANIILKRDFEGLAAGARLGAATDGGDEEQQYDLTAGHVRSTGGIMGAFSLRRSTEVTAGQRTIAQAINPDSTLFPWIHQYGGVVTGHQDLGESIHFEFDSIYNHRTTELDAAYDPNIALAGYGSLLPSREKTFSVTPKIIVDVGTRWTVSLFGTYGTDDTAYRNDAFVTGIHEISIAGAYRNRMFGTEASAEGPLFSMPAGDVRLALGGGFRANRFTSTASGISFGAEITSDKEQGTRKSYYGFAELSVPLVSEANAIAGIHALSASAAVRWEDYPGIARIATPKLGLIYAPIEGLTFKASWGKSFKAPTLYDELQYNLAVVEPASDFGAVGAPAGATAIFFSGGNPGLKPERATAWSGTAELQPAQFPGLDLQITYFRVNYRDRIGEPVDSETGVLVNPLYQDLITFSPSAAYLDMIVAATPGNFLNYTGGAYDPAKVYAVIDDRKANISRQAIHGVDLAASYKFDVGMYGMLSVSGAASYLQSRQTRLPMLPSQPLAGTIFNPPTWRGRGGLLWAIDDLTVDANLTYLGGVTDNRAADSYHIRAMAPVDLAVSQHIRSDHRAFDGIDLTLAVRNIQNAKPALIRNSNTYDPTYDSSNYPAIGRFVSFSIGKKF